MRPERTTWAGAKTWLLAAVAGWALVIWALGLVGLGGRIEPLPEDPTLLQRLPQPAPAGSERLGPIGQYGEIGARPLFSDDRRPHPFFIDPEGEGEAEGGFEYILTSVLLTPRLSMAIVQPSEGGDSIRLKLGEAPESSPGYTLASVAPRSAVFNGPDGEQRLELRVFDGVGGEPPTAMAPPQAAQPATPGAAGRRAQVGGKPPIQMAAPAPGATAAGAAGSATAGAAAPAAPAVAPPPAPAAAADAGNHGADNDAATQAQAEAIRQRIEARREQLREQSQRAPLEQTP